MWNVNIFSIDNGLIYTHCTTLQFLYVNLILVQLLKTFHIQLLVVGVGKKSLMFTKAAFIDQKQYNS